MDTQIQTRAEKGDDVQTEHGQKTGYGNEISDRVETHGCMVPVTRQRGDAGTTRGAKHHRVKGQCTCIIYEDADTGTEHQDAHSKMSAQIAQVGRNNVQGDMWMCQSQNAWIMY